MFERETRKYLSGSLLTSEQANQVARKLKSPRREYERYVFDGELFDAFMELFGESSREMIEAKLSIKDEKCTKQFFHPTAMLKNVMAFSVPERRYNGYNINVKVAGILLRKYVCPILLRPLSLYHGMDTSLIWSNKNASAGVLGLGPKGSSKEANEFECIDVALRIQSLLRDGVSYQEIYLPARMFHRGQITDILNDKNGYSGQVKLKDRFVWGLDGGTCTFEAKYAMPIIDHLMDNWYSYVGGDTPDELRRKIKLARKSKLYWASMDFSKFDQTIPSWLIHLCFDIIREFYPRKYWNEIGWIEYNFIHTGVICQPLDGTVGAKVYVKDHGIPSGSCFTQVVGSMCNMYMMLTYLSSLCNSKSIEEKIDYVQRQLLMDRHLGNMPTMFVMGDDNLIFTESKLDIRDVSGYVYHMFGVRIHADDDKSALLGSRYEHPHFLKREWRWDGEYIEPVYLIVNTIHNERDRDYVGKKFSPWHIIYGLYKTYKYAFPRTVSEGVLLEKMQVNGVGRVRNA